jgi:signal transduction histidine kinase
MSSLKRVLFESIVLLAFGFASIIAIVAATFWLGERARIYSSEVALSRDIRAAATELRNALQTAESSQRGYVITGNQIYLAPFATAKARADDELESLNLRLATEPAMRPRLDRLAAILAEKSTEMERSIALKRERRDEEAVALIRTNRGKALTDEANVFLSGIIRAADDRLTASAEEQSENARLLRWVTIAGVVVIVLVVALAAAVIGRYTREIGRARAALARLNDDLERRVLARTGELTRANEEVQRFAYVVSHDLRAPLVNIMGFTGEIEIAAETLREGLERAEPPDADTLRRLRDAAAVDLPEAIGFIRTSTKKMDALIGAVLKLSREGRRELRHERVDLAEAIEQAAALVRHRVQEGGGALEVDVAVDAIVTDRLSLDQILGNLIDNAVKYRAAGRPLGIRVAARPLGQDRVEITVSDNGRGIAPADHARVFEPFQRSGRPDEPGEGIGLAHVRSIVRKLGGDMRLTSELGAGSTFHVVLPRRANPSGPATEQAAATVGPWVLKKGR